MHEHQIKGIVYCLHLDVWCSFGQLGQTQFVNSFACNISSLIDRGPFGLHLMFYIKPTLMICHWAGPGALCT